MSKRTHINEMLIQTVEEIGPLIQELKMKLNVVNNLSADDDRPADPLLNTLEDLRGQIEILTDYMSPMAYDEEEDLYLAGLELEIDIDLIK